LILIFFVLAIINPVHAQVFFFFFLNTPYDVDAYAQHIMLLIGLLYWMQVMAIWCHLGRGTPEVAPAQEAHVLYPASQLHQLMNSGIDPLEQLEGIGWIDTSVLGNKVVFKLVATYRNIVYIGPYYKVLQQIYGQGVGQ
jgi:hypothetical protein